MSTPNDQDPPEDVDPRKVYIAFNEDGGLYLFDAHTQEQLSDRWENNRHNLIDLAIANDWDVVDGPIEEEEEDDWSENEPWAGEDPSFDPMFLM